MKLIAYLRTSTTAQDYQYQLEGITKFCEYNGHSIVGVREEKLSGAKDDRPVFQSLLTLTKKDCDGIIVYKLDRLGRRLSTVIKAVEDFKTAGINVISIKETFQALDINGEFTMASKMCLSIMATMAECERESILERTHDGLLHKAYTGEIDYTSKAPYGYTMVNKRLVIDDEEAFQVAKMFDEYKNGFTHKQIALAHGMNEATVGKILKNTTYYGKHYSKLLDKIVDTPAIVTRVLFDECRAIAQERNTKKAKPNAANNHPMKGKLYDAISGRMLTKSGDMWQCKDSWNSISVKAIDKACGIMMELINKMYADNYQHDNELDTLAELKHKMVTLSNIIYNLENEIKEDKLKLEVLKGVLTAESLKKEARSIKLKEARFEAELANYSQVSATHEKQLKALQMNVSNKTITDYTEQVFVSNGDRKGVKILEWQLTTGDKITMRINARRNEFEII